MTVTKTYMYFGDNGTFTSPVHIPDVPSLTYLNLHADEGMMLTNGTRKVKSISVLESAAKNWYEIEAGDID